MPTMASVSVLFARSDSCYFDLVSDVWDAQRDARGYTGPGPIICHPPCRAWGRLRHWAKPRPDEKALALFAVEQVRRCGGVLEHPWGSTLWPAAQLPRPGERDAWGGWTLLVDQGWWGHAAPKPTYLYIVGCERNALPDMPVQLRRAAGRTLELSPADRERTPPKFAAWLVAVASLCARPPAVTATAAVTAVDRIDADTPSSAPAGCYFDQAVTSSQAVTAGQVRCNTDQVAKLRRAAAKRAALKEWAANL